ncbi:HAD hydrolase family protein [Paracoccus benzoatiresistens]|uniref:HAD hydrolase family protein n=1 Tax=Paracoccus benzoatiresistens TaxID=2997341 RepID=A0ABT4JAF4_9RHOB|nr:HAD hydrolase family protein [Paracoccus sp. EF6]MCZ0964066.1 HAD hydrolase family protein [Paracoccus sp. EF6]
MYFRGLATDYEGTLAEHGIVPAETVRALRRLGASGRRLILLTGRQLEDLQHIFPELALFDRIVAENGGVIFDPVTGRLRTMAPPPPFTLIEMLMRRHVEPISVGHTIVATWVPHEAAVLEAIEELGLEFKIIFNKGAVMVMPRGIDKASGLAAALHDLRLSKINVVGVGDAENDGGFLAACGCSSAVANALGAVKQSCDIVLSGEHGAGVNELVERILREDVSLAAVNRHGLLLGRTRTGDPIHLSPGRVLLVTGGSGTGKSTYTTLLTEQMAAQGAEFCIIDPEGDYDPLEASFAVGGDNALPSDADILALLERTGINLVLGLHGADALRRRERIRGLLPPLVALREEIGRPHWLIIDEVHQFLPRDECVSVPALGSAILVTVGPEWISGAALAQVDAVVAFGNAAGSEIKEVARERALPPPATPPHGQAEGLYWRADVPAEVHVLSVDAPQQDHHRHRGKYAIGNVGDAHAFAFRDCFDQPIGRAVNLAEFVRLAAEVSDEVWERHLRAGDYTAWFFDVIRDEKLGYCAMAVAARTEHASESRARITAAIRERYTIPGTIA